MREPQARHDPECQGPTGQEVSQRRWAENAVAFFRLEDRRTKGKNMRTNWKMSKAALVAIAGRMTPVRLALLRASTPSLEGPVRLQDVSDSPLFDKSSILF